MRRFDTFPIFVMLALLVVLFAAALCKPKTPPLDCKSRTEHMISYMDKRGDKVISECSGISIAPHAIMTAEHCDKYAIGKTINLDLSTREYTVVAGAIDERDHAIYLLDGPAFKYFVPISELENVAPPRPSELLCIYGNGEEQYPGQRKCGTLDVNRTKADPSEIDKEDGGFYTTIPVVPGDSGAPVFGEDGRVVGLVTYQMNDENYRGSFNFSLNFSHEILEKVLGFVPEGHRDE